MAIVEFPKTRHVDLPHWGANITSLPIRISRFEDAINQASAALTRRWKKAGLPTINATGRDWTTHADKGHVISFAIPEAHPERIAASVSIMDLGLAVDMLGDVPDCNYDVNKFIPGSSRAFMILAVRTALGILIRAPKAGFAMGKAVMEYQRSRAKLSAKQAEDANTFTACLPMRFWNFYAPLMLPFLLFTLGITLSAQEVQALRRLDILACTAMILSNDLMSWPTDMMESEVAGIKPDNIISVLMRENGYGCDEEQGLVLCRRKLLQYEIKSELALKQILSDDNASPNTKKVAQAYTSMISGLSYWYCVSPRYSREDFRMDLVKKVLQMPASVQVDEKFDGEFEQIYSGCVEITHNNMKYYRRF